MRPRTTGDYAVLELFEALQRGQIAAANSSLTHLQERYAKGGQPSAAGFENLIYAFRVLLNQHARAASPVDRALPELKTRDQLTEDHDGERNTSFLHAPKLAL